MPHLGKTFTLIPIALVIAIYSMNPQSAPLRSDLSVSHIITSLGGIFVIVLLVERVTEIVISIWKKPHADILETAISTQKNTLDETNIRLKTAEGGDKVQYSAAINTLQLDIARTQSILSAYKADTKASAMLVGFSLAIVVCAAGVGLLSEVIAISALSTEQHQFLRGVDIVLTSGLIAGGSDSFHLFVRTLETFFSVTKNKLLNTNTP